MRASRDPGLRVVVTGYGIHAATTQIDDAFAMRQRNECPIGWQELSDDIGGLRCVGAACSKEPPLAYLTQRKWLKYMGLETQFAVWAAGRALQHAGLWGHATEAGAVAEAGFGQGSTPDACQAIVESMALMLTTGPIAFELKEVLPGLLASRGPDSKLDYAAMGAAGLRNSSPMMPFHTLRNMPIGLISMVFGIKGPNAIFYPDAEQSLFAFSTATRAIQYGRISTALVGGTAQLLSMMPMVSYRRRGYLAQSPVGAIPFGSAHQGWALGDAAAMVVLESERHARARGAKIYGILGVEPTAIGMAELLERDLRQCPQPDLTLVTGTQSVEQDEVARRIGGERPCLSLDSITGYTGAASIALNLAAACRLLDSPSCFDAGRWWRGGSVEVLSAVTQAPTHHWGNLRLEVAS